MMNKIAVFILLLAISTMASTTSKDRDTADQSLTEESGKVNVITLDSEKLEAIYYSSESSGIHIMSEVSGDEYHLDVRNLDGVILMSVDHPDQTASTITIMGHQFLILNNTISETERYLTGYAVPATFSKRLGGALKKKRFDKKVLRNLDFDGANQSRALAMEQLLNREEIVMMQEAAEALGNLRIMGNENPAAMSFYMLAIRLTKFRNQLSGENVENEATPREKRGHCWWSFTHCPNNGQCCWSCPVGNNCLGMCGPGCNNCWWFVCGTCCRWQGCYNHDVCCSNWNSWGCQIPAGFNCNYYNCYSDSTIP